MSKDGINFSEPIIVDSENLIITELEQDSIYYIKLKAVNQIGDSPYSEVLAGVPSSNLDKEILIVNGFDRTTTGNTYNFVRQHSSVFKANFKNFNTATNDAVLDGIVNLGDYCLVDYILGEESTADETFSVSEQTIVSEYLKNGGNIFVSGSEIAWDLDYKGSTTDKNFIWNYLKMKYTADAPFEQPGIHYSVQLSPNRYNYFNNLSPFSFDNGNYGSYNVKYPDVILPQNGSEGFIKYSSLPSENGFAGIMFSGLFLNGVKPGKVLTLGFPFETIYPESVRNDFIGEMLKFFYRTIDVSDEITPNLPSEFSLEQNYPNPFNPTTTINYTIPVGNGHAHYTTSVLLKVYDILGREVATLVNKEQSAGYYSIIFDAEYLTSGIYYYRMTISNLSNASSDYSKIKKMILLK